MGLKNILLTLEKRGFLVFRNVVDMHFLDDIENISPCFTTDVYGIFYYTYDDYFVSLQSGYLTIHYFSLDDDNINVYATIREICNTNRLNEYQDYEFINSNDIRFKVDKNEMKNITLNKKQNIVN